MPSKLYFVSIILAAVGIAVIWGQPFVSNVDNRLDPLTTSGEFDSRDLSAQWNGETIDVPLSLLALDVPKSAPEPTQVLGEQDLDKHIEVDLTNQTLTAFEGGAAVHTFSISSGKWGRTPTGTFRVWSKFRYTKMEGGSKAIRTYYYLPNVPYTMFFSNSEVPSYRGFAIHGAYWHNNFGHPMSHGCINMDTKEAGVIYEWANPDVPEGKRSILSSEDNPGTEVVIFGEAPQG